MPTLTISNTNDVIDSRDVNSRIEELEGERETLSDAVDTAREALEEHESNEPEGKKGRKKWEKTLAELKAALVTAAGELDDWDKDDDQGGELKILKDLAEEGEGATSEWDDGATLIHENHFTDYCQELVSDIGDMPKELPSYLVIDWEATADNLRHDYTSIDYQGQTYYVRS